MSTGATPLAAAAAAAGTDPAAGKRSAVVDKDLVPDLSLSLFMFEITYRTDTDSAS